MIRFLLLLALVLEQGVVIRNRNDPDNQTPVADGATLWVDVATGSDSYTRAQVRAGGGSVKWQTLGRAVWGSTTRSSPNTNEAAAVDDVVAVTGGTYDSQLGPGLGRHDVLYNPANEGTSAAHYITFSCVGDCILTAPEWDGPAIGAADRDYIKWYADVTQGYSWQIDAYGSNDEAAPSTSVNTTPDTGPVVCVGSSPGDTRGCWIEGFDLDGSPQLDYTDNYPAIRFETATGGVARNNTIRDFINSSLGSVNAAGIQQYHSPNTLVEHNDIARVGTCLLYKDTTDTIENGGSIARFNKCADIYHAMVEFSQTNGGQTLVYQNTCNHCGSLVRTTGGGLDGDWIFNNTGYDIVSDGGTAYDGFAYFVSSNGADGRVWGNIVTGGNATNCHIYTGPSDFAADTIVDFEHNVYHGCHSGNFLSNQGGGSSYATFAAYTSANTDQDLASPASITSDPRLANPSGGNFLLCTASGVPHASCAGASPAINLTVDIGDLDGDSSTSDNVNAGAYVTGNEVIGLEQ